jgi:hypothetical protein
MANLNIITDRNWNTVAEDMITEAFWPTLSTPTDIWPTAQFEADSRLKGTLVFGGQTSTSELPLICYMCTDISEPKIEACQVMSTELVITVKMAFQGPADIDESTAKATRTGMGLWGKLVECIAKQDFNDAHTAGEFGYANSTVVGGRGTGGIFYGVHPIRVGRPSVINSLDENEPLNKFAADVWTITGDIRVSVWHN